jgi:PhnB protein
MTQPFKPPGYPSLSPYLMVRGGQAVIEFLKQAFGATELRRFDGPGGSILHAEVRIQDSIVMLSEGTAAYPAFPAWLHLYLPDVDAAYSLALKVGGKPVQPTEQKPGDPDRRGGVLDPSGNTWWISTQVASPAQV